MSAAFDYRLMREDRGWYGFPAIDINLQIPKACQILLQEQIGMKNLYQLIMSGDKISPQKALQIGAVDICTPLEKLETQSIALAQRLAQKDPETYRKFKIQLRQAIAKRMQEAQEIEKTESNEL